MSFCKSQDTPIQCAAGVIVATLLHHKAHDYCALCTASVTLYSMHSLTCHSLLVLWRCSATICRQQPEIELGALREMKTNCAFLLRRRRRSIGQGLQFSVKSLDFFISVLISGELFRTTSGRKNNGGGDVLCGCGLYIYIWPTHTHRVAI